MFITSNSCSIRWSCRRSSPPFTRKGYSCSSLPRIVIRFGFLKDSITLILEKDRKKQDICDRRLGLTESSLKLSVFVILRWYNQVAQLLLEKQVPAADLPLCAARCIHKPQPCYYQILQMEYGHRFIPHRILTQKHTRSSNPEIFAWYSGSGFPLPSYWPEVVVEKIEEKKNYNQSM